MERKKSQEHLRNVVLTAVFAAMVYVLTAFLKIPTHQGYIHIGDGIIYLAAAFLPGPYAMAAGAIGAGLSDYLSGYAHWVIPTMIIKAATAAVFTSKKETVINKRNLVGIAFAVIICVGGYFLAGTLLKWLAGSDVSAAFLAALSDVPTNCIQGVASSALFVFLGLSLDRMDFKKRFLTVKSHKTA